MRLPERAAASVQEVLGERQHVLGAIAQRRQHHLDDVEAIEEILAERALAHALRQIAVGRRQDAHVDLLRSRRAERAQLALLQHAQELGLQLRRQVADLVEEDGAAVGLDELALAIGARVGEGAALVAEQLRLEQRVGDGGAVDRDERLLGARRVEVQRARHQLLAGAALAGDEHVAPTQPERRRMSANTSCIGADLPMMFSKR